MTLKFTLFCSILFLFFNCENKKNTAKNNTTDMSKIEDTLITQPLMGMDVKTPFSAGVSKGVLENEAITEASGLAASRLNKGLFWTHNDSKDANRLFLFDENGRDKGTFFIDKATNRDWEDLEMATINNTPYIYVADIGDNDGKHEKKYIYRVKEPKLLASSKPVSETLKDVETITFKYPDDNRNAEALMIDQKTFDIYIVTKFEDSVHVYTLPFPQSTTQVNTAKFVTKLPMTFVTAGTISLDNQEILIKNTDTIFYWKRKKDESIAAALKRSPTLLPYIKEPQGEAIAFAVDGSGYYTLSEIKKKIKPNLYFYKRQK
jgi:hypothetical protein